MICPMSMQLGVEGLQVPRCYFIFLCDAVLYVSLWLDHAPSIHNLKVCFDVVISKVLSCWPVISLELST